MLRDSEGFTLIEMLVSLALLSIMSIFSVMAISNLSYVKRVEQGVDDRSELNSVRRLMYDTLADVRPMFMTSGQGQPQPFFSGSATQVRFVAPLDDLRQIGGLYQVEYAVDAATNTLLQSTAVLRLAQTVDRLERQTILEHVENVRFRYYGKKNANESEAWHDEWQNLAALPQKIEIGVVFSIDEKLNWQKMIVTLQNH
jgi:prepilin-type N-terminal cleavage/methylation domain-containing protein